MPRAQFKLLLPAPSEAKKITGHDILFPQISRFFSATTVHTGLFWTGRLLLWTAIIALFVSNTVAALNLNYLSTNIFLPIFQSPSSPTSHMNLGMSLWHSGYEQTAKSELLLAQDLTNQTQNAVLGASTDPTSLLETWTNAPVKQKEEMSYWKSIIQEKPDYREVYLILGALAFERKEIKEATSYWQHAYALDPTDVRVIQFLTLLPK